MTDNVIHLEDLRLTRKTRAPYQPEGCAHLHLTMHAHGETITCDDCSQVNRELAERRRALLAAARKSLRDQEARHGGQ